MNKRIQKLAEQVEITLSLTEFTGCLTGQDFLVTDRNLTVMQLEKFAELIVKECMDCSTWVGKVNKNAVEPIHTAHAINQRIKKHFGVQE